MTPSGIVKSDLVLEKSVILPLFRSRPCMHDSRRVRPDQAGSAAAGTASLHDSDVARL